jgi:MFS superfamily sulfate permease-like transporter
VFAVGVEQGIVLAIILSILDLVRRQYEPHRFVVGTGEHGQRLYRKASPGVQTRPGLVVFRYDADLFYANANRFVDDVEKLIDNAPDQVRWLVLDAGGLDDIDYSAGVALAGLLDYLDAHQITLAMARVDPGLVDTLRSDDLLDRILPTHLYSTLHEAINAFRSDSASSR